MIRSFQLRLDEKPVEIEVSEAELESLHFPLLDRFVDLTRPGERAIVFIAGPAGCGKTAVAALWVALLNRRSPDAAAQTLSMDGFHFPNAVIRSMKMEHEGAVYSGNELKGFPDTFEVDSLESHLRNLKAGDPLRWPAYCRETHEPIPGALSVVP